MGRIINRIRQRRLNRDQGVDTSNDVVNLGGGVGIGGGGLMSVKDTSIFGSSSGGGGSSSGGGGSSSGGGGSSSGGGIRIEVKPDTSKDIYIERGGGVRQNKIIYHGSAIVPGTNKTANQLQRETFIRGQQAYGRGIKRGQVSGRIEMRKEVRREEVRQGEESRYEVRREKIGEMKKDGRKIPIYEDRIYNLDTGESRILSRGESMEYFPSSYDYLPEPKGLGKAQQFVDVKRTKLSGDNKVLSGAGLFGLGVTSTVLGYASFQKELYTNPVGAGKSLYSQTLTLPSRTKTFGSRVAREPAYYSGVVTGYVLLSKSPSPVKILKANVPRASLGGLSRVEYARAFKTLDKGLVKLDTSKVKYGVVQQPLGRSTSFDIGYSIQRTSYKGGRFTKISSFYGKTQKVGKQYVSTGEGASLLTGSFKIRSPTRLGLKKKVGFFAIQRYDVGSKLLGQKYIGTGTFLGREGVSQFVIGTKTGITPTFQTSAIYRSGVRGKRYYQTQLDKNTLRSSELDRFVDISGTDVYRFNERVSLFSGKSDIGIGITQPRISKQKGFNYGKTYSSTRKTPLETTFPSPQTPLITPTPSTQILKGTTISSSNLISPYAKTYKGDIKSPKTITGSVVLNKEVISQSQFTSPKISISSRSLSGNANVGKTKQKIFLSGKGKSALTFSPAQSQIPLQKQIPLLKESTLTKQTQLQKQSQLQKQTSLQKSPRVLKPFSPTKFKFKIPFKRTPTRFFPKYKSFTPTKEGKGYSVQVRRFGKFKTIGTGLSLKQAYELGREKTTKTLGATFKLSGKDIKRVGVPAGYYKKSSKEGTLFIEKPTYRLSTPTEIGEIKMFKRKKGGIKI